VAGEHFLSPLLVPTTRPLALVVAGRERTVATTVEGAFSAADRTRGLLGRPSLARDSALVIAPCSAIHTFAMQFPIDVIFTARDGRVLRIRHDLAASNVARAARAFAAIEMAAGEAARHELRVGDQLRLIPQTEERSQGSSNPG